MSSGCPWISTVVGTTADLADKEAGRDTPRQLGENRHALAAGDTTNRNPDLGGLRVKVDVLDLIAASICWNQQGLGGNVAGGSLQAQVDDDGGHLFDFRGAAADLHAGGTGFHVVDFGSESDGRGAFQAGGDLKGSDFEWIDLDRDSLRRDPDHVRCRVRDDDLHRKLVDARADGGKVHACRKVANRQPPDVLARTTNRHTHRLDRAGENQAGPEVDFVDLDVVVNEFLSAWILLNGPDHPNQGRKDKRYEKAHAERAGEKPAREDDPTRAPGVRRRSPTAGNPGWQALETRTPRLNAERGLEPASQLVRREMAFQAPVHSH